MPTIQIEQSHSDICKKAAAQIAQAIKKKPNLVLGLATGNTMEPLYAELVRMHKEEGLDFSKVQFFNLDEYEGVKPSNPISFNHYLRKLFLSQINAQEGNIHLVQGDGSNVRQYDDMIQKAGGIDIQLVGIGGTGHIGFNEKGSAANSRTRKVELDERTIMDNAALCGGIKHVPHHAYTQGIGTILQAKHIIMLGNGGHKAQVVHDMLTKGSIAKLPARALKDHQNVTMYLDAPSAEMLTLQQLQTYAGMSQQDAEQFRQRFDPIRIDVGQGQVLTLPYNADIFIPGAMKLEEKFDPKNGKHVASLKTMLQNAKVTYMGAHQDDTEIEVPHAIEQNFEAQQVGKASHFLSIIATDGAAYTTALQREGKDAGKTPEMLIEERKSEQRIAAEKGKFAVIQLQYPSASVKSQVGTQKSQEIVQTMASLYNVLPHHEMAYSHAPIDTHETHVAVLALATQALREASKKPQKFYGMEGWGELGIGDTTFAVQKPDFIGELLKSYRSQLEMQKRPYDEIAVSRIRGNGFMGDHHAAAQKGGMVIGIDLSTAINPEKPLSLTAIVQKALEAKSAQAGKWLGEFGAPGSPEKKDDTKKSHATEKEGPHWTIGYLDAKSSNGIHKTRRGG